MNHPSFTFLKSIAMRSARFRPRTFVLWLLSLVFIGGLLSFTGEIPSSFITLSTDVSPTDVTRNHIDLDVPTTMKVGEEVTFRVNGTHGFTAADNNITWTVAYSETGNGNFGDKQITSQNAQPRFTATQTGEVKIVVLLTVASSNDSERFAPGNFVAQEFSIQVLK